MDAITLRPDSTALLVVDIQERLLPAMPEFDARRLLACTELLVESARLMGLPVFATEQYPRGLGRTVPQVKAALDRLDPPATIAEKTVFSAMAPAEVARGLATHARRAVVLVGMEAHVCVFQTARDLAARGFRVHVPFDAVASRDPACRATALELLRTHGAAVTTTETVVFDLLHDAQNPHFKALSALVKALPQRG